MGLVDDYPRVTIGLTIPLLIFIAISLGALVESLRYCENSNKIIDGIGTTTACLGMVISISLIVYSLIVINPKGIFNKFKFGRRKFGRN